MPVAPLTHGQPGASGLAAAAPAEPAYWPGIHPPKRQRLSAPPDQGQGARKEPHRQAGSAMASTLRDNFNRNEPHDRHGETPVAPSQNAGALPAEAMVGPMTSQFIDASAGFAGKYSTQTDQDPPDSTIGKELLFGSGGHLFSALGRHEEAIAEFSTAIRIKPESGQCYLGRGKAMRALDRYPEARDDLVQAATLLPDSIPAHEELGIVYAKLSEAELAKAASLSAAGNTVV